MKLHYIERSGNILTVTYDDGSKNYVTAEYVLGFNHYVIMYEGLYDYMRSENVENGMFAMCAMLNSEHCDYYWPDKEIGYHKDAVLLFAGEERAAVEKKLKPFLAKERKRINKSLKVIDFELRGRQMLLYLGEKGLKKYWGDDWNDAPYEHNAGSVYDEYVADKVVVNFKEDEDITEICEGLTNSSWCKQDFMEKKAPFAYIKRTREPEEGESLNKYFRERHRYSPLDIINDPETKKFWFEMPVKEFYDAGYLMTNP